MDHFTAIKVIERLAPQINSSQDPKGTLIKFASENNLSPAELERLGQVFNSAKTLSHLEKSANRGDSYDLLDVEDLVSSFTSHETPTVVEKSASTKIRNGGALPNFFDIETLEKQAGEKELHPVAESIFRNQRAQQEQELKEFQSEIPTTIHDLKTEVVKVANAIVRDLYLSNKDAKAVFTKLAEDSQASVDSNKDAIEFLCKKAFTYFGEVKVDMEKVASRKVVTDTTGLLKKAEEMQDMINVMHELDQILKSAAEPKFTKNRPAVESVSDLDQFNQALALESGLQSDDYAKAMARAMLGLDSEGNEIPTVKIPGDQEQQPAEPSDNQEASAQDAAEKSEIKESERSNLVIPSVPNSIADYIASRPLPEEKKEKSPVDKTALNNIKGFVDNMYDSKVKKLLAVSPTSRGYVNAGVDKTISSIETASVIQELMQDPVISAHTPSTVVSIYNSLAQVNPSMMRDKNVAKFALREALQYEGVTPHTYGQMVEIDKDKSDIAKNELQTRKEIYGRI